jgi:hypothetical protein
VAGPDWPLFDQFQLHVDVPEFVYAEIDNMLRPVEGFSHPTVGLLKMLVKKVIVSSKMKH